MAGERKHIVMIGHKHILSREGGIEIVVKELAVRMVKKGYHVICYDRMGEHVSGGKLSKRNEYEGVLIQPVLTINKKGLAAMSSSFFGALKAAFSNADIIHFHAEGPAAMSWIPRITGKRIIVTIHGLDWKRAKWGGFASKYIKWGEKQAVKYADEIIVLSRSVQEYFKKTYGRETEYIPNGVSASQTIPANLITEKWGLIRDSYVLFVGRIVPEKGLSYLIEAWKDIKTEKKLVIVGGSSDTQAYMKELKQLAAENILFTGFQQGRVLEELYSNAFIYCLPSDVEGMPLSLLEAMSYGNCCVVSDIPECKEVVDEKAITFVHSDIENLKTTIEQLLNNQELVYKYKRDAANYITNKFNWDNVVERTLEVYLR